VRPIFVHENNERKKVMKTIGTLVLVLAAIFAGASDHPRLDVVPVSEQKAVVTIANENPARIEVTVKAEDGSVLYRQLANQSSTGYRKVFDFSGMEDGSYELAFRVNNTMIKRDVALQSGSIMVGESEMRFDPYFAYSNDVLKVTYLNFEGKPLTLAILRDGTTMWESNLGDSFSTMKGYDVSALESGEYDVILAGGDQEYSFSFDK
jgi:hypothetical protein